MAVAGVGLIAKGKSAAGSKPSLLIALLVFIIHLLVIGLLLHDRAAKPDRHSEQLIQFRLLPADIPKPVNLAIDLYQLPPSTAIVITPLEPFVIDSEKPAGSADKAQLSGQSDPGLFDPRLRKTLSEMGGRAVGQTLSELKSWSDASGTRIVEVRPGECIRAMPGAVNARGDNWSLSFKCGKSGSERMMDNINADMAERKRKGAR